MSPYLTSDIYFLQKILNNKKKKQVIYESADLVFHLLVLWKKLNIKKNDIAEELLRRKNDKRRKTI